jgi:hypothetical protein
MTFKVGAPRTPGRICAQSGTAGAVHLTPESGDQKFIAKVCGRDLQTDQANAEFMVRAWNNLEELIKTLQEGHHIIELYNSDDPDKEAQKWLGKTKAILEQALNRPSSI